MARARPGLRGIQDRLMGSSSIRDAWPPHRRLILEMGLGSDGFAGKMMLNRLNMARLLIQ
jgi:hypothetical protein